MDSSQQTLDPVVSQEDAATAAARKELKHTAISEGASENLAPEQTHTADENGHRDLSPASNPTDNDSNDSSSVGDAREQCSPKKKRSHDQVDQDNEADDSDVCSDSSAGSRDRANRLQPEKKRPRDEASSALKAPETESRQTDTTKEQTSVPATSKDTSPPSAFASSGFAKLSSSASPFGALATAPSNSSVFTNSWSPSPAPAPIAPSLAPTLTSTTSSASPFLGLGTAETSVFGGGFGVLSGFGSLASTGASSAFGKPGAAAIASGKPAKPFGAPDSDAEQSGEEDDSDSHSGLDDEKPEAKGKDKDRDDDKKKQRLHKVDVDDGEADEATILAVRAKLFHLDKESGWKERGAGMLKVNVPVSCVKLDYQGVPIPGSFDAADLDTDAGKVPRLILRQDQTHRVLLNTAILPQANFQEKATLRATNVLFTSFEGDDAKPVSITAKMSAASAKTFLAELRSIQQALCAGAG